MVLPKGAPDLSQAGPGPVFSWTAVVFGVIGTVWAIATSILAARGGMNSWQVLILVLFTIAGYIVLLAFLVRVYTGAAKQLVIAVSRMQSNFESIKSQQASRARILELAHGLNDEIAEYASPLGGRDILRLVKASCQQMARAFTDSLGVDCRVCVKHVVDAETARPRVRAIERSDRSVGSLESELHYIDQNTDFNELYLHGKKFWFSNNVDEEPGYINSSPNRKYHSTIVWPITTRVQEVANGGESLREGAGKFSNVAAFLCIDSDPPNLFSRDLHIPLGWPVVDALARAFETAETTPAE